MKKNIVVCLLFGMCIMANSQIITITDLQSEDIIELVTITSKNPKAYTLSNKHGKADITTFKGSEIIEIRAIGYKPLIISYSDFDTLTYKVSLEPTNVNLDEVIVSASRWRQNTSSVPSKISVISPKMASIYNPQTSADLLGISGKVFIQKSQQGGGSPMIRGFATNRLLYSVDGVRMNTAIFRSGNIQNVISIDPFSIEQTEVMFGPGSVIYGSDAIGGVMSFRSLVPQFSLNDKPLITGKAAIRYSSANNEKTGHFDINIGWNKWAAVTSISSFDFDDLKMGSHGPEEYLRPFYVQRIDSADVVVTNNDTRIQNPSGYSQINLMQKISYKPVESIELQYGFTYSETSEYSRYDRHIRYKNGLPRYGEWNYGPQKWMMNNLSVTHNGNNLLYDQSTLRLAWQYFEESRIDRNINDSERHIRIEKVDAMSANLDFAKSVGTTINLFYGFEGVQNFIKSKGTDENISTGISAPGPSRYPQSTWASYAAYFSGQINISEKILLQAGMRYNQYLLDAEFDTTFYPFPFTKTNLNDDALTGSIGLVFRPDQSWVISTNASTAFRSPNVDDMGKVFDSEPGSVVIPNPDLEAEYAYNIDLGLAKTFSDVIKIDITTYYTYLKNAMVRRDFTLNGEDSILYDGELSQVQAIQNAAVAIVYGIQTGIEIKLPFGFSFSTDFNYQKGEEELDNGSIGPSRHAPPWFGTSRLNYSAAKLNLKLYAVYSGEKKFEDLPEEEKEKTEIYAIDANGNPYSPGWYTLNIKSVYQLTDQLSLSVGVENITDQRYRPYSSGIVASGRNFIMSVKAVF